MMSAKRQKKGARELLFIDASMARHFLEVVNYEEDTIEKLMKPYEDRRVVNTDVAIEGVKMDE